MLRCIDLVMSLATVENNYGFCVQSYGLGLYCCFCLAFRESLTLKHEVVMKRRMEHRESLPYLRLVEQNPPREGGSGRSLRRSRDCVAQKSAKIVDASCWPENTTCKKPSACIAHP